MLRRLRIKFILINMLLVTLVLLAVFGTLVYSTASQLERESVTVMTLMLRRDGIPPQFVADASHELKTPLTVILANAGIVEGHPDETVASQHKWISYIQEEAQRMKGLVEDMLFLAKHDDARQSAKTQVCNLSDLVTGCVLRFESVAFESGVELDSEIQPRLSIHGDLDCLERLVMILLDNAVKYAGEAGRVRLELQRRQERAVLTVTNTGQPIPPEHLDHLFQRFYRADGSRSRKEGGYGLGLAIAHTIVQFHRGQIEVKSDAQNGTCFTVTLPRVWQQEEK
ncbi:sensor histidine kinase [Flintibacter sp.]|uniref:sensor histidine kinase n=1 Tax=Flintibacter TaxID=1918454 RepID=UPI003D121F17|nr:HAMP domain-containing histidine kinase [Flintibacter sp.]